MEQMIWMLNSHPVRTIWDIIIPAGIIFLIVFTIQVSSIIGYRKFIELRKLIIANIVFLVSIICVLILFLLLIFTKRWNYDFDDIAIICLIAFPMLTAFFHNLVLPRMARKEIAKNEEKTPE